VTRENRVEYLFVTWEDLEDLVARLAVKIWQSGYRPELIVGVSRGGLVPTRLLSDFLNVRDVIVLGVSFYEAMGKTSKRPRITHPLSRDIRSKRVLLIDDVSDTGGSLQLAKRHVLSFSPGDLLVCTLHRKPWSKFHPDIYVEETDRWIIYPWEKAEAAGEILAALPGDQRRELASVGFSERDLDLLEGLGLFESGPNHLGGYDEDGEG